MIRSTVITLGTSPAPLQLSEARGFALSPYQAGQTWPVLVTIRDDRGEESAVLVREGVWYALGARVVSASAQLPPGSPSGSSYILDVGRTREDAALPVTPAAVVGAKASVTEIVLDPGDVTGRVTKIYPPENAARGTFFNNGQFAGASGWTTQPGLNVYGKPRGSGAAGASILTNTALGSAGGNAMVFLFQMGGPAWSAISNTVAATGNFHRPEAPGCYEVIELRWTTGIVSANPPAITCMWEPF